MRIVPVTGPGPDYDAWYATYAVAEADGRPYAITWQHGEILAKLQRKGVHTLLFSGVEDDEVVAVGWADIPLEDNLTSAELVVAVMPAHRRRGLGTRMLEHLLAESRAHGRSRFVGFVSYPYDAPADGTGHPGTEFLRRHGFDRGIPDVQRVLDLPVAAGLLDRLAAEAAPMHAAYELRSFAGPVPDEIVETYLALESRIEVEAPTGDMEMEPSSTDVDAFREQEANFVAQRRTLHTSVALLGGEAVAYSRIAVPAEEPGRCYQWGTLVAGRHRGHRLGMAVKVANLRHVQDMHPGLRLLVTFNAAVNDHMIAINEQLGFRAVERGAQLQRIE